MRKSFGRKRPFRRTLVLTLVMLAAVFLFGTFAFATGDGAADGAAHFAGTAWALLPPLVAIVLAFLTKEVYSSLFAGCLVGAMLVTSFDPWDVFETLFLTLMDNIDLKIFFFDVLLGTIVILFARSGGSRAFGDWAARWIKSKKSALVMTSVLGCLIFLDDYFNCLTVGTIMMPITDRFKVSRAKLAYMIDATAAPICIIAPISSWAAAVASYIPDEYTTTVNGFTLFVQAIPYNFYALLTLVMVFGTALMAKDYGPMYEHEANAAKGDLFTTGDDYAAVQAEVAAETSTKGTVWDLLLPTFCLIGTVVWGMVILGRRSCLEGDLPLTLTNIFANTDAPLALSFGCVLTLLLMAIMFIPRKIVDFKGYVDSYVEGFKLMIPALLVLTFAWGLKAFVGMLDVSSFVQGIFAGRETLTTLFPMFMFLMGGVLAFATGTSWGTMGILIPVAVPIFAADTTSNSMLVIVIASICAGAIMGDHCSPISDTTIMSSTGAQCNHINHVKTQMYYGLTVCADCVLCYILAAVMKTPWIPLAIGVALVIAEILVFNRLTAKKYAAKAAQTADKI